MNDALTVADVTGSLGTFASVQLLTGTGTSGDLVNSNCQIIGLGSSVTKTGNYMTLFLNTHFRAPIGSGDPLSGGTPGFIGQQNVYMLTNTSDQQQPGSFQLVGTWTAYPVPEPGSFSSAVAISAINSDGTMTIEFNDPNGFNYQPYGEVVLGASQTDPNACRIRYDRGSGAANHILSLYAGDFTAVSMIGTAPVGSPGVVVQDNNTCILDVGNSYVVQESGDGAIVHAALKLKATGLVNNSINTYAQGFDRQNAAGAVTQSAISIAPTDFSLSPVNVFPIVQGAPAQEASLTIAATGAFSGAVSLQCSAPAGITFSCPSATSTIPNGSVAVPLSVSATTAIAAGTYTGTISGTASGLLQSDSGYFHSESVYITVVSAPAALSLTSTTGSISLQQSASISFPVAVAVTGAVSGTVSFAATSTLSGVSVSFQPNLLTLSQGFATTVQVSASAGAAQGSGFVTITATSGTATYPLTIPIQVNPFPPSFSLTSATSSLSVQQSGSAVPAAINIAGTGSFSGTVSFAATAPTGINVIFQPSSSVSFPASSSTTIQVSASASAVAGNIVITATSGSSLSSILVIPVQVNPPAPTYTPFFTVSEVTGSIQTNPNVPVKITLAVAGSNGWTAPLTFSTGGTQNGLSVCVLSGLSCVSSLQVPVPGTVTIQLTASGLGYFNSLAYVTQPNGISGPIAPLSIYVVQATVPSNFQISVPTNITVPAYGSSTVPLTVNTQGTPPSSVTLSSASDVSFSNSTVTSFPGNTTVTFNAGDRAAGTMYQETISVDNGAQSATVNIIVAPRPLPVTFTVPGSLTLYPGTSSASSIQMSSASGFSSPVSLSVSSAGQGIMASLSTSSASPPASFNLSVSASSSAAPQSTSVTIVGAHLGLMASTTIPVTVNPTAVPMLQFTNLAYAGSPNFQVGDSYTINITGTPMQAVVLNYSQNGNAGSATLGTINTNGSFSYSNTWGQSDIGDWTQVWTVGGVQAGQELTFTVVSAYSCPVR